MSEFKKRESRGTQWLKFGKNLIGVAALAFLAFFAGRATLDMYGKFAEASTARAAAEAQLSELESRYTSVKTEVDALNSPRGLEAAVRERYGMVRPGEGEIDIVRSSSSTEAVAPEPGVVERLWHLLFVW